MYAHWRHRFLRFLWHYCWSSTRRYFSIQLVDNLPKLRNSIVDKSNKRKWLDIKKKVRSRWQPTETITDVEYTDVRALLAYTPSQAEPLLHSLEQAIGDTGLYVNANKTEYTCFDREGAISTPNGTSLKLLDNYTLLCSSASSPENDVNIRLAKKSTHINWLSIIWKSDLSDKIKRDFFQAAVVS